MSNSIAPLAIDQETGLAHEDEVIVFSKPQRGDIDVAARALDEGRAKAVVIRGHRIERIGEEYHFDTGYVMRRGNTGYGRLAAHIESTYGLSDLYPQNRQYLLEVVEDGDCKMVKSIPTHKSARFTFTKIAPKRMSLGDVRCYHERLRETGKYQDVRYIEAAF